MKQKTGRYLLSLLFALAMVTGLLPGTSVTAWANDGLVLGETDYSVKLNPSPYCLGDGGSDTPDASKCVSASVPLVKSAPLSRVPLIHGCVIVALE